jgi:hypothetical protein
MHCNYFRLSNVPMLGRMAAKRGACPECGLDVSALTPRDAAAAARSYPRRFRAAGATATRYGQAAAAALDQAADDLYRVLVEDDPVLTTRRAVGGDLEAAADRLARTIDSAGGDAWTRTGSRGGETVDAIEIVRDAVHEGAHQLRAAQAQG